MAEHMIQMGNHDAPEPTADPRLSDSERRYLFDPAGYIRSGTPGTLWLLEQVLALRERVKALEGSRPTEG